MAITPVTVTRVAQTNDLTEQFIVYLAYPAYRALRRRATAQQQTPEQVITVLLQRQIDADTALPSTTRAADSS